ncbi:IS3 family transposase, partial [Paenibacillus sp. DMB5]|uniref:IS3 family transposase n=1 Tax=Paenibacillus sp. DMB5 TaxID=1780103 RepID=UPI0018E2F0BF
MVKKGQKFTTYPYEMKLEAIRLHVKEGWTYRRIMEKFQLLLLQDHGVWMNHKKVLRLMQVLGIRSRIRRKHRCNYASTTEGRVAKNLLK